MRSVTLGFGCNNACAFCAQGALRERVDAIAGVEEALVAAAREGGAVALVGGEPTIDPRLFDLVRLARNKGATRVVVQTNGRRLAYRAFALALREAGVDAVDVALHGSTASMHDYHTSVEGSFAQTLTGLGVARKAALDVGVTIVVTRSNYRHLADIVRLVAARGASAIHFASLVVAGGAIAARERLSPNQELVAPFLAAARDLARSLALDVVVGEPRDDHRLFAGTGAEIEAETPRSALARGGADARSLRALPIADRGRLRTT